MCTVCMRKLNKILYLNAFIGLLLKILRTDKKKIREDVSRKNITV